MLQSLTSYDNATPGTGNVVNDVQLLYNPFGQLTADFQSHSGPVDMASTPSVGYSYEDGSSGTIRRTGVVYPNGRLVGYQYASGGDDAFNRVTAIVDGGSASAEPPGPICPIGPEPVRPDRLSRSHRCATTWLSAPAPIRTLASTNSTGSSIFVGGTRRPARTSSASSMATIWPVIASGGRIRSRPQWA